MTAKHPKIREYLHYNTGFYMVVYNGGQFLTSRLPENFFKTSVGFVPPGVCTHVGKDSQLVCFAPNGGWNLAGQMRTLRRRYPDKTCKEAYMEYYAKDATEAELEWIETYVLPYIKANSPGSWCDPEESLPALSWTIFVHEFAHAMDFEAIREIDPKFKVKLVEAWENAIANELWTIKRDTYAATNAVEYWAVNTQFWFFPAEKTDYNDGSENKPEISQRTLKELDPKLYALLSKWYPATEFILPEQNMFH